jgi:hypothetical protein
LGGVPPRPFSTVGLLGGLHPLLSFVRKICSLHWHNIVDVLHNINNVGLQEHYLVGSLTIQCCFDIVEVGTAVVQDCPREPVALFWSERFLQ